VTAWHALTLEAKPAMNSSSTSDLRAALGSMRHQSSRCAGCGELLRPLENRHSVGDSVFHVECVPTPAEQPKPSTRRNAA